MQIFWFIPTHGDSRYLGTRHGGRAVTHNYLKQVAQAAAGMGLGRLRDPTSQLVRERVGGGEHGAEVGIAGEVGVPALDVLEQDRHPVVVVPDSDQVGPEVR